MKNCIKVLHFSTHDEDCGIGKYQEMFLEQFDDIEEIENKFFDYSPNQIRTMTRDNKIASFQLLEKELERYDILHIQHEFSFYPSDEFKLACETARKVNKKLIVTVHTSPSVAFKKAKLHGYGLRSVLHFLRESKANIVFYENFSNPVKLADLILVHNTITKATLVSLGAQASKVQEITIPVPQISHSLKSSEIAAKLNKQPGDIIYATTGFLHQFKGVDEAIKALTFLPENYKLAVIGGMHIDHQHDIYNRLTDLIRDLHLIDRVYITGYVKEDEHLNSLIRECDICVYPYEKIYYSSVSSAALNNAFANFMPVVAYPTASFKQINNEAYCMSLTQAFSYYELARNINNLNLEEARDKSKKFAKAYSYPAVAKQIAQIYSNL